MLTTTNRLEFTDTWVRNVAPPPSGRQPYYDTICPSLVLIVTHKGAKTFYRAGRPSRTFIGHPNKGWTVAAARTRCNIIVGELAKGTDPRRLRKTKGKVRTLGWAFNWYLENYAKPHKRTWKKDVEAWEWLRDWEGRNIRSITRADFIERLNQRIQTHGVHRARHEMKLLNSIMKQMRLNRWIKRRPGAGVKLPQSGERSRHLNAEELQRFFQALADLPGTIHAQDFKDCVLVALFTAARRMNVFAMAWSEIHKNVWTIPAAKAKENKPIAIPLIPEVQEILARRKQQQKAKPSEWVFPTRFQSKFGHRMDYQKTWEAFTATAKLDDFHFHDLRHTMATWMVDMNISREIIAKVLGHTSLRSTAIYAKVSTDPVDSALRIGSAAIKKAAAGQKSKKSPK